MSHRFEFVSLSIPGLYRVIKKPQNDSRGFFCRSFCAEEFREIGLAESIAQINHTLTKKRGSIRGMHFQNPPHAEVKIISCIRGKIFDVVVDVRKNSPTYLHLHMELLGAEDNTCLYVPKGLAHGFQTLTDDCEMLYLHSQSYEKSAEGALNPMDPKLAIDWPLETSEISDRDRNHPMIDAGFKGV
ncbi:dTDP-4-keto-6-deoxy-D-glucose epimerase [Exilibacterium tricleocarpae]|uniref:dTDP-4-dehydrorhamnose 3,5-epimerase n=1 Tax=Exilibacterium tricleocarpae TaxID=2591008 RepID=A0A545TQH9_9GAMM|nr:dTDP-4-dehydrorhamnose 3,5-epimerase family protein [Exilibacterium tricleocarpae]TQV79468.1 dTDP-4-keto-6-deoxy-D-glucose epimerase [Exilibacterium tricleocarpae]